MKLLLLPSFLFSVPFEVFSYPPYYTLIPLVKTRNHQALYYYLFPPIKSPISPQPKIIGCYFYLET